MGTVFNTLFGTLSQDDADKYLAQFKALELQALDSEIILDKLTTLISATAEALQQVNSDSLRFRQKTDEQFALINNITDNLFHNYDDLWINM